MRCVSTTDSYWATVTVVVVVVAVDDGGSSVELQAEWNMSLNKLNIEIIVGPVSAPSRIRCTYVAYMSAIHTSIQKHLNATSYS